MDCFFGPYEAFKSKDGAIIVNDGITADASTDKEMLDEKKCLEKKLALRPYRLVPAAKPSFWDAFDWILNFKIVFVAICIICICLEVALGGEMLPLNRDNPLLFAGLKPGSYTVEYDKDGVAVSYKLDKTPTRTVTDEIPTGAEAQIALAYKLYQIGNKAMVASPYAAYYEIGNVKSTLKGLGELPLNMETIDIRNNVSGEHFRQTYQNLEPGEDLPVMVKVMGAFSVIAKRWYVTAGSDDSVYISTIEYDKETNVFDWNKAKDNAEMNQKRLDIAVHPIPYTASGYEGKINGLDKTEAVEETGTYWEYDAETGYSLPYYIDGAGRIIGFEKTDQHISYDPTHASREDVNGEMIEDYFTTIKEASVTYNAEDGYYEVTMKMDSTKEYTHIDTLWALKDSEGAKDENSKFTKFEVKFQLWDNGYFKEWEMWEDWTAPKAYGFVNMTAIQKYTTIFSYDENDMDFSEFYTPSK